jgi:hypothetical protein
MSRYEVVQHKRGIGDDRSIHILLTLESATALMYKHLNT